MHCEIGLQDWNHYPLIHQHPQFKPPQSSSALLQSCENFYSHTYQAFSVWQMFTHRLLVLQFSMWLSIIKRLSFTCFVMDQLQVASSAMSKWHFFLLRTGTTHCQLSMWRKIICNCKLFYITVHIFKTLISLQYGSHFIKAAKHHLCREEAPPLQIKTFRWSKLQSIVSQRTALKLNWVKPGITCR